MSDKGADSRTQDVSGESSVLGQLGRDLVYKSFTISKQGDDWEPYVGPRGGEGWKNPETGEIIYGDMGDVAEEDDSVDDPNQSGQSGDSDGDFLDIDPSDIEEGQYISVDGGEAEGYIDGVERLGDDVRVMFEDGASFWVDEDMQLEVDDSPEEEELGPYPDTYDIVDDNVEFLDRNGLLSADEVKDEMVENLSRVKSDEVVENTTDHVYDVQEGRASYYNQQDEVISIKEDDMGNTVDHEVAHAIMGANGFHINEGANILAVMKNAGTGKGLPVDLVGETARDVVNNPGVQANMSNGYLDQMRDQMRDKIDGLQTKIDEDYLKLTPTTQDINEELTPLVEEVNNSFEKMIGDLKDGDAMRLFAGEYAASNGQEVFAALHEKMQMGGLDPSAIKTLYRKHPELVDEYTNHFEPNDYQKRQINRLYQSEGSSGPIQEEPFPEAGTL